MSSSPSHLGPGTLLRDYRIESELGRGGQGVVYLAEHIHLRRRVALKVLPPEFAADEDFRERFLREARIAAALEHPNILPIYDASEANGVLFLAMRLVQGEDLGIILQRDGALQPARALDILAKVAGALDEAHAKGLVHRDVKPSNILLEAPDRVFLSDFGLGKVFGDSGQPGQPSSAPGISTESRALTRAGYFVGTPHYAAPEQIQGGAIGPWTDEYALAAVLFESVTGRVPFPRDVETATLVAQVTEAPPAASSVRPGLSPALDRVITSGMAKRPEERYRSCTDLVTAARSAVGGGATIAAPAPAIPAGSGVFSAPGVSASGTSTSGSGVSAAGVTPPPAPPIQFGGGRPPSGPRRRFGPWMIGAAAGVAVAVVAGIVFLAGGSPSPTPSPSLSGFASPTVGPTTASTTAPTTAPPSGPTPTTGPPPLTTTTITRVEPFDGAGNIQPPFSQTEEHKGTCFSGSLVDNRPDAWRCFANGNSQIFDPCFENFPGSGTRVGCLANPNDHGVVLINLTQPLDPAGADPGGGPPGDWTVVLADNGTTCLRFGGAQDQTIGGKPVEFLCQDGRAIGGDIDRKKALWSALVGELKPKKGQPPKSPDIVNITQAFG